MNRTTIGWGRIIMAGSIAVFALSTNDARAQVPEVITFQGSLKDIPDPPNDPIPVNGCLNMTFRIYTSAGSGPQNPAAWTEVHGGVEHCVQVTNGQFSTGLGTLTLFNTVPTLFDQEDYLGIQVGSDSEMTPRKPFTSVGYSLRSVSAQNADHAGNADHATNADTAHGANAANAGAVGFAVKGAAGQTAALQQWQDGMGNVLGSVDASGRFVGNSFAGNGGGLRDLNADYLTEGRLSSDRFFGTYSGNVTISGGSNVFAGDGAGLTNVRSDYALKVNEKRVAVVVTALQSGALPAGSAYYPGPLAAMSDLATWCGFPSQSAPCEVRIMPGSYSVTDTLQMIPWVDIVGSGENATRLICGSAPGGCISGAPDSALSFVTLEVSDTASAVMVSAGTLRHLSVIGFSGPGTVRTAIVNLSGGALEDVGITNIGGPGILVSNSPSLTNVRISATDGDGIAIAGGSPALTNITIVMAGNQSDPTGIFSYNGATPTLTNVAISASSTGSSTRNLTGVGNMSASPKLTNVVIRLSSSASVKGVQSVGSSTVIIDQSVIEVATSGVFAAALGVVAQSTVEMHGVTIRATNSAGPSAYGLQMAGATSTVEIDHCTIAAVNNTGGGIAIERTMGSTLNVGSTKLDAVVPVSGSGMSQNRCVFVYNGTYLPLNSTCQ